MRGALKIHHFQQFLFPSKASQNARKYNLELSPSCWHEEISGNTINNDKIGDGDDSDDEVGSNSDGNDSCGDNNLYLCIFILMYIYIEVYLCIFELM